MIALHRPRPRSAFFLACALSIIWTAAAQAKTTTIDDSGTQALEPSVSMRWETSTPSRTGRRNLMVGTMAGLNTGLFSHLRVGDNNHSPAFSAKVETTAIF